MTHRLEMLDWPTKAGTNSPTNWQSLIRYRVGRSTIMSHLASR